MLAPRVSPDDIESAERMQLPDHVVPVLVQAGAVGAVGIPVVKKEWVRHSGGDRAVLHCGGAYGSSTGGAPSTAGETKLALTFDPILPGVDRIRCYAIGTPDPIDCRSTSRVGRY